MFVVITTHEDPPLMLARLRHPSQLSEIRTADQRFIESEATDFLNQVMGLNLTAEDVAALDRRIEGWVAGLQLAALSMKGPQDDQGLIRTSPQSLTGVIILVKQHRRSGILNRVTPAARSSSRSNRAKKPKATNP
jgi:ATP/maltotriose-dependent transcriptional regulator MalT